MSEEIFVQRADRRLRLMLRHTWLMGIAGTLLLVGAAAAAFYFASRPTTLKIAVAAGSEDMRVVQAIAQHLARDAAAIRLQVVSRATSVESGAAIEKGEADLAV